MPVASARSARAPHDDRDSTGTAGRSRDETPRLAARPLLLAGIEATPPVPGAEPPAAPAGFLLEWGRRGTGTRRVRLPHRHRRRPQAATCSSPTSITPGSSTSAPAANTAPRTPCSPTPAASPCRDGRFYLAHFPAMRRNEEKKPDRVSVYDARGRRLRQRGRTGNGDGEFDYPGGIAISPDSRVCVADRTNHRGGSTGTGSSSSSGAGRDEDGSVRRQHHAEVAVGGPQFLAIDPAGSVFTTEGSIGRVQEFAADGRSSRLGVITKTGRGASVARSMGSRGTCKGRSGLPGRPGAGVGQLGRRPGPAVPQDGKCLSRRPGRRSGRHPRPVPGAARVGDGRPRAPLRRGLVQPSGAEVCHRPARRGISRGRGVSRFRGACCPSRDPPRASGEV